MAPSVVVAENNVVPAHSYLTGIHTPQRTSCVTLCLSLVCKESWWQRRLCLLRRRVFFLLLSLSGRAGGGRLSSAFGERSNGENIFRWALFALSNKTARTLYATSGDACNRYVYSDYQSLKGMILFYYFVLFEMKEVL